MKKVKRVTERIRQQMRASWRRMLFTLLRAAYRVQDGIEQKLSRPPQPEGVPKP
jgi:hypothetical protein